MTKKNARNTRGKIVNAAWKLFYEQGYEDTTVEEIIENPFSYTFLLRAAGGEETFGWEIDKELWKLTHDRAADVKMPEDTGKCGSLTGVQALCGQTVTVSFPANALLLLRE